VEQANATLNKLGAVFVMDSSGKYVYGNLSEAELRSIQNGDHWLESLAKRGEVNEVRTALGTKAIVISIPIEGPGLSMVGVFPIDRLNIKIRHSIGQMFIVLIVAIVLLSLIVYWVTVKLLEKEAELKALEAQINPHYLYNTLATISWAA